MNRETNLEHYKKELTEILLDDYDNPRNVFSKISDRLDGQIKMSLTEHPTDAILNLMAQPYKETILDKAEKEYLSAVIKPFRNRVIDISLCGCSDKRFIRICVRRFDDRSHFERIELPYFKTGTMYKGMEYCKYYSLEELGL